MVLSHQILTGVPKAKATLRDRCHGLRLNCRDGLSLDLRGKIISWSWLTAVQVRPSFSLPVTGESVIELFVTVRLQEI